MQLRRFAVVLGALFVCACGGIRHDIVHEPSYLGHTPDDIKSIGLITSAQSANGQVYLGATHGLAAVDASGKTLWTLALPDAQVRLVDADAQHVAWTAYDVTGVKNDNNAITDILLGRLGDKPQYSNAQVGLVSPDGKALWSVKSSEQTALSPPALSSQSVGVSRGASFAVYAFADGKETVSPFLDPAKNVVGSLLDGMLAQATRLRPAVFKDAYYAAFFYDLAKFDLNGKSLFNETNFGLFSPFEDITVGPVVMKDHLVFGLTPSQKKATVISATAEPSKEWKEYIDDMNSGPASIFVRGDALYVATNFHVTRYTASGSEEWDAVNNGGGLYPSSFRGLRFVNNFGTRRSHGNLLAASDKKVFISSTINDKDVITVLNAENGKYVETINVAKPLVELLAVGDKIAAVSLEGVDFLPAQ